MDYRRPADAEATYGDLKRIFRDVLRAGIPERIRIHVHWPIVCFNRFKAIRKASGRSN